MNNVWVFALQLIVNIICMFREHCAGAVNGLPVWVARAMVSIKQVTNADKTFLCACVYVHVLLMWWCTSVNEVDVL